MELIDKCVHCGKPKEYHNKVSVGVFGTTFDPPLYYCKKSGGRDFKSITVAAAEKNAVRNLELLIEVFNQPREMWDIDETKLMLSLLLLSRIERAIEDSTPKE